MIARLRLSPNQSYTLGRSREELAELFTKLVSTRDVALLLDVSYGRLVWHLWRRPAHLRFVKFQIKKRRGGLREIAAPQGALKIIQHKLAEALAAVYQPGASAHGFITGRSIVTNARQHVARRFVLNVDIENFFPSINFGRLRGLFMARPYQLPEPVATTLAQICFAGESELPQGAPTSPIVANMICAGMDAELSRLARKHRCSYSRYSDDITFSSTKSTFPRDLAIRTGDSTEVGEGLARIVAHAGFRLHPAKHRLQTRFDRQEVTGLVTNKKVNVRRGFVRQVRAMLHAWEKFGYDLAEEEFRKRWDTKHRRDGRNAVFSEVLQGKLAFIGMVRGKEDRVYTNLVIRARKLHPRFASTMTREDAVIVIERSVEAVADDGISSQGTAFLLDGVGVVTASHVVCHDDKPLSEMRLFRYFRPADSVDFRMLMFEPILDIAVGEFFDESLPRLKIGDPSLVNTGDELLVLGYPHWNGGRIQQTEVKVTGRSTFHGAFRIHLDRTVQQGNSGGPALNADGEVIGIVVTGSNTGEHPNAVVPITVVLERARQLGIRLGPPEQ